MKTGKGGFAAEPELDIFMFLEILFSSLANLATWPTWPASQISRILLRARI